MKTAQRTYPDGLKQAILAVSFFRSRHDDRLRFKHPKPRNAGKTVPVDYTAHNRATRKYIAEARKNGFRGSVVDAAMEVQP